MSRAWSPAPIGRQRVRALGNWTTIDGVNFARSEAMWLVSVGYGVRLGATLVGMAAGMGDAAMAEFAPKAAVMRPWFQWLRWGAGRHRSVRPGRWAG
jgi:hypothetical protein